jgi:hypothetical protein
MAKWECVRYILGSVTFERDAVCHAHFQIHRRINFQGNHASKRLKKRNFERSPIDGDKYLTPPTKGYRRRRCAALCYLLFDSLSISTDQSFAIRGMQVMRARQPLAMRF